MARATASSPHSRPSWGRAASEVWRGGRRREGRVWVAGPTCAARAGPMSVPPPPALPPSDRTSHTKPPQRSMRLRSVGSPGLWSVVSSMALPRLGAAGVAGGDDVSAGGGNSRVLTTSSGRTEARAPPPGLPGGAAHPPTCTARRASRQRLRARRGHPTRAPRARSYPPRARGRGPPQSGTPARSTGRRRSWGGGGGVD
jgi:hypothetical protein